MKTFWNYFGGCVLTASLSFAGTAAMADPLMGSRAWQPRQEANRASIAALMMQREQMRNPATSYAGAVFTCGGGTGTSTSSATANSNCAIIVDSDGNVLGSNQTSDGDQTATSDTTTTANGASEDSMSAILESMQ